MRSKFCPSCGGKNEFSYQPPKFCSCCGAEFDNISLSKSKATLPNTQKRKGLIKKAQSKQLKEDETDVDQVPSIAKFECDIDVPQDNIHNMSDILNEERERT